MRIALAAALMLVAVSAPARPDEPPSVAERFKEADRDRFLKAESFTVARSVASIPPDVWAGFTSLLGVASIRMADPEQDFQATDVIMDRTLPSRRLRFSATSEQFGVLHYEKGGFARRRLVLVFARRDGAADLVWGGTLSREVPDLAALKDAVRKGELRTRSVELNW
jgi:hypothetical protein